MSKIKEWFRKNQIIIVIAVIFATIIKGTMMLAEYSQAQHREWIDSACPSMFSIARSARDTLIVMKAEHSCNQYLMENLR